jgi:hypothetical protein
MKVAINYETEVIFHPQLLFLQAYSQNCEKRSVLSRPFVRPHGTILLPLNGFSIDFISEHFSKICRGKKSIFIKIWQEWGVLYINRNVRTLRTFSSYLAQFFLELETFQTQLWRKKTKKQNKIQTQVLK